MVFKAMEMDLRQVIKKARLEETHCVCIFYQLLRGLKYVHSAKVIHGNLKPANILVHSDLDLVISDFRQAWCVNKGFLKTVSLHTLDYISLNVYLPPEVICSCPKNDVKLDIWACGCIFVELFTKCPLFPARITRTDRRRASLNNPENRTQIEEKKRAVAN